MLLHCLKDYNFVRFLQNEDMTRIFLSVALLLALALQSNAQFDKSDLTKLVQNLNSRYDEQNPILSPDGQRLYFTRANDSLNIGGPGDKGDIWVSELGADGRWAKPVNLGQPVNDYLKNYLLGFSPDGKIIFLNQEKRNPGGIIVNDGIAFSMYASGKWSKPAKVSVDYLMNNSSHQSGSISADGTLMLLSLQAYASRGEEDIYICTYKDGKWTQPINLGSDINTSNQEMTPYLSPDKKKLYFSSNGYGGKGGRDLFVAERTSDSWTSWSKPKNLGSDVNSFGVELNYFIDSKNEIAYFSSTQNSDGYGDIRAHDITVEIEEEPAAEEVYEELIVIAEEARKTLQFTGKVLNNKTQTPIPAAVIIQFGDEEQNVSADDQQGMFVIELPLSTERIEVNVKSPGFMSHTEEIEVNGDDKETSFLLEPLEVGTTIRLNKVYFQRGTPDLLENSFAELNRVVDMMQENPTVKIELSGHTDNQGSSKLNIKLSQERVEKVKMYLTEHGIESKRIKGKGYGGSQPVASNASEETRKLNRRVEIKILKN